MNGSRYERASMRLRNTARFGMALLLVTVVGCSYKYREPAAELIVTSNRGDAFVFLVPREQPVPTTLSHEALKAYRVGRAHPRRGIVVSTGTYWLLLEKDGVWSNPVEVDILYGHVNDIHVDF